MNAATLDTMSQQVEILLVDDDPTSIRLAKRALEQSRILNNVTLARDGIEAMQMLRHEEDFSEAPRPHLILLDLNMPRMDGREVLAEIKSDPKLSSIPVIILTTSSEERDIQESYAGHANSYIVKPMDFIQLQQAVLAVSDYWFSLVHLPSK